MKTNLLLAVGATLSLVTSCIVSDELTTLTIHPDGSADWIAFRSNIRSTETGDKAKEELRRFAEEFDAGRTPDVLRIREAGGEVVETRWVRREAPYATVVVARLPRAEALQDFWTFEDGNGERIVETRFTQDGRRRRLAMSVRLPADHALVTSKRPSESKRRQERADGVSETRIAISGGRIVSSAGFTVASDGRSALLDVDGLQETLRTGRGKGEIFIEWELDGE